MNCIKCESKSEVIESRMSDDSIRRRRKCKKCEFRFTTFERIEDNFSYSTLAKDLMQKKLEESYNKGLKDGMELSRKNRDEIDKLSYSEILNTKVKPKRIK